MYIYIYMCVYMNKSPLARYEMYAPILQKPYGRAASSLVGSFLAGDPQGLTHY